MHSQLPHFEVQRNEPLAVKRTVPIQLIDGATYLLPVTGAAGIKAQIMHRGGTSADSSADTTELDAAHFPGVVELVLTQAEVAVSRDLYISCNDGGCFGHVLVRVVEWDPLSEGATSDRRLRFRAGRPT